MRVSTPARPYAASNQTLMSTPQNQGFLIWNIRGVGNTQSVSSCSVIERRNLLDYMMDFSTSCKEPWLIGRDFNSFLGLYEKKGGKRNYSRSTMDFQACVSVAGLEDAGSNTWADLVVITALFSVPAMRLLKPKGYLYAPNAPAAPVPKKRAPSTYSLEVQLHAKCGLSSSTSCSSTISRNRARFQEHGMSAKHIMNRTMLSVRAASINLKIQQLPQPWLKALKENGNNLLQQKIFVPTVVKWMHPPTGRIKLNVDGAFKSAIGIAGGGGILRDHNGDCIFAFAANYQRTTSALDAEARALRDGLAMCCTKGFLDIMVETDSLAFTQSVTGQALRPWELTCIFQEMVATSHLLTTKITQVPREANQTAHYLANYGCSIDQIDFWESGAVLPHTVKGPYHLDKVGCPTLKT
ncbi:hypothetical protein Taro_056502 [Colocasia esculenta]|uniref:RNase H type-1 domain-containing protein n=1 Tax=Colocasia esculenta TaxID=4460 RepID=A0A843XTP3_COLES|nr:hypothetical protein [Colocasia esculenta]